MSSALAMSLKLNSKGNVARVMAFGAAELAAIVN
jgi:hypothetical protein